MARLCATWQKAVQSLDFGDAPLPPWGPPAEEIIAVRVSQVTSAVVDEDSDGDSMDLDYESDYHGEEEDCDSALISTLYAVDQADAFRTSSVDEYEEELNF